jgi:hypothetical protein
MSPRKNYPTLSYWQSIKNIQVTHNCCQILVNEPQIFTANPYAASIYGCIRQKLHQTKTVEADAS